MPTHQTFLSQHQEELKKWADTGFTINMDLPFANIGRYMK